MRRKVNWNNETYRMLATHIARSGAILAGRGAYKIIAKAQKELLPPQKQRPERSLASRQCISRLSRLIDEIRQTATTERRHKQDRRMKNRRSGTDRRMDGRNADPASAAPSSYEEYDNIMHEVTKKLNEIGDNLGVLLAKRIIASAIDYIKDHLDEQIEAFANENAVGTKSFPAIIPPASVGVYLHTDVETHAMSTKNPLPNKEEGKGS